MQVYRPPKLLFPQNDNIQHTTTTLGQRDSRRFYIKRKIRFCLIDLQTIGILLASFPLGFDQTQETGLCPLKAAYDLWISMVSKQILLFIFRVIYVGNHLPMTII